MDLKDHVGQGEEACPVRFDTRSLLHEGGVGETGVHTCSLFYKDLQPGPYQG
jgi:hypothetical protein